MTRNQNEILKKGQVLCTLHLTEIGGMDTNIKFSALSPIAMLLKQLEICKGHLWQHIYAKHEQKN